MVSIYTLFNPEDNIVRYVGKTVKKLGVRLSDHISDSAKGDPYPVNFWIRNLFECDLAPQIQLIEEVGVDVWQEKEKFWIAFYKAWNSSSLLNINPGGEGAASIKRIGRLRVTHCKHGHEYTSENMIHTKSGYLRCRICDKKW
jgi:hypothetical protein